jgi:hypothetical protein
MKDLVTGRIQGFRALHPVDWLLSFAGEAVP